MTRNKIIVAAILMLSLMIRVYDLDGESLWIDEGWSISFARMGISEIFCLRDTSPPLYYLLLHWWIGIFGISEFAVRFPSVIFGVASVWMMYKLGEQFFNRETGILAALLLGLSAFHIYYSQEARVYSLLTLLTLLSMYYFMNFLRRQSRSALTGYGVATLLLMYAHIYGSFVVLAQNLYVALIHFAGRTGKGHLLKRWLAVQILVIGLFALWLPVLIPTVQAVQQHFWLNAPAVVSVINTFIKYSGPALVLPCTLLALFSAFSCETIPHEGGGKNLFRSLETYRWQVRLSETETVLLAGLWLLIPIAAPFILSRISTPIYHVRYTIPSFVAFQLLTARGISNIGHRPLRAILIGVISLFSLVYVVKLWGDVDKEPWREVAKYVDLNARKGDVILFNKDRCQDLVFDYYSENKTLIKKPFPRKTRFVTPKNIRELGPAVKGYERVWVILSHTGDRKGLIISSLSQSHRLSYCKEYKDIRLYLFGHDQNLPEFRSDTAHGALISYEDCLSDSGP